MILRVSVKSNTKLVPNAFVEFKRPATGDVIIGVCVCVCVCVCVLKGLPCLLQGLLMRRKGSFCVLAFF